MKPEIVFDQVSKSYRTKKVLNDLSFTIDPGRFVGLIGNNGCGKTTTVNILCNLIPKDSGDVTINGEKIAPGKVDFKRKLGIVLSEPYYIPDFRVSKYLQFVGEFQGIKGQSQSRILDLAAMFDMGDYLMTPIKKLSSGEQMKVSLSAALIHNPSILILDEPFVNLDINTSQRLLEILTGFKGKKSALITSHNLDLVSDLCDEFLIMDGGQVLMDLTKDEFGSVSELKERIKELVVKESEDLNFSWLS